MLYPPSECSEHALVIVSRLLCICERVCSLPFDYTLSGHDLVPVLFVFVWWRNPIG